MVDYLGDADVVYEYDSPKKGALSSVSGGFGLVSYAYDDRLRPVQESWIADGHSWIKNYGYDSMDRVVSAVYPDGGQVTYSYDDMGLLDTIPGVASFTYDAFGRIRDKSYANGVSTELNYYPGDFRLHSIVTPGLQDLSYTYDDVGNIKFISSSEVEVYTQSFNYDDLGRLVSADETGGFQMSFKYDSIGNLLLVNSSGVVSTYTYGTGASPGSHAVVEITGGGGQSVDCSGSLPPLVGDWIVNSPTLCKLSSIILSLGSKLSVTGGNTVTLEDSTLNLDGDVELDGDLVLDGPEAGINFGGNGGVATQGASPAGTQTLMYDDSGSLTSGFGLAYEYDDANRLRKVSRGGAVVEEYVYDHGGNRFKKVSGGDTTYYLGKDYQTKVNASGTYNTIYYYANGELMGRKEIEAGQTYFYHNDHLGGTHVVTDSSGNEVPEERTRYLPFGGILTGGAGEIGWTGHRWDQSTGQVYMVNRYYRPDLKRFTQADTEIPNVYNPQSLNRYSYVNNNPLRYTDPTGHWGFSIHAEGEIFLLLGAQVVLNSAEDHAPLAFIFTHNEDTGEIQVGTYDSQGLGVGSPSASLKVTVTYYDDSVKQVSDVGGTSLDTEVDVGIGVSIGGGISNPVNEDLTVNRDQKAIHVSFGVPDINIPPIGSGSVTVTETKTKTEWSNNLNGIVKTGLHNLITGVRTEVDNLLKNDEEYN